MRKIVLVVLLVMLVASSFAGKGDMQIGPTLGLIIPTGDIADILTFSPKLGGKFLYGFNESFDFEGNLSYGLLQIDGDYGDLFDDITYYMVEVSGAARYTKKFPFYFGGGFAYNTIGVSYEVDYGYGLGTETYDSSDGEIGIFGFGGYIMPMNSFDLDLQLRAQLINGDLWMNFDVGFNFPIGK